MPSEIEHEPPAKHLRSVSKESQADPRVEGTPDASEDSADSD